MILESLLRSQMRHSDSSPRRMRNLVLIIVAIAVVMAGMAGSFGAGVVLHRDGTVHRALVWSKVHASREYWVGFFSRESLPRMTIEMNFLNLQKIETKRQEALRRGNLLASSDDFVSARLTFGGRTIPVDMRLKGDQIDHLAGEKWSFRIELKGDNQLLGMRRLSIHNPSTRNYLFEWAYLENLRTEGILAPRYEFIDVTFNGENHGIYAIEEHFSKELLESQGRREGIIIRFNEDLYWEQIAQNDALGAFTPPGNVFDTTYTVSIIDAFRDGYIEEAPNLVAQRDAAIGLLRGYVEGKLTAAETFDVELMGRFLAINELWDASHGLVWHNLRFYYNPVTAKLEPIGFDAVPFAPWRLTNTGLIALDELKLPSDPAISEVYVRELDRVKSPEYLTELRERISPEYEKLRKILFQEFGYLPTPWNKMQRRQQVIKNMLSPVIHTFAFTEMEDAGTYSQSQDIIQVELRNFLTLPVDVLGFRINGGELITAIDVLMETDGEPQFVPRGSSVTLLGTKGTREEISKEFVSFQLPIEVSDSLEVDTSPERKPVTFPPEEIRVITRILGLTELSSEPVIRYPRALDASALPAAPSTEEALVAHPFLEIGDSPGMLFVQAGEWNVSGNLILPQGIGLEIGPGTTLLFEPNAILYSSGALNFQGTSEAPIILGAQGTSWDGVVVLKARVTSTWTQVQVRGTNAISRDGWMLSGGITFFESSIVMEECLITDSLGEDAFNVIRARFKISSCVFGDAASDAFDSDFSTGIIIGSSFHDIGDDAIDFSGSVAELSDITIIRVGDKGISVGEASDVTVWDILIKETSVGIASKDLSHVTGGRITIEGAEDVGLAAYTKKSEYGPGDITLEPVEFIDTDTKTLIALGSWIRVNGSHSNGADLDTDALSEMGMGN